MDLTDPQRKAAVETARLVGLEVAAVDLLDVKGMPKVFEVNSSPALTEMEAVTGIDLAGAIIQRAEALVAQTQSTVRPAPKAVATEGSGSRLKQPRGPAVGG